MNNLIANRSFVYVGAAEDIKNWTQEHGYKTEDILDDVKQAVAFRIVGTGIKVGYYRPLHEFDTGKPKVHLLNDPALVEDDIEAARRGIELYRKLYNKFRERKRKNIPQ